MHTLSRQIRFTLDPFSRSQDAGFNAYASKPGVHGVGIHFSLWVDLAGDLEPDTGFVVNVSRIDQVVRRDVIPLFAEEVYAAFQQRKTLALNALADILSSSWRLISKAFSPRFLRRLTLELSPFRNISIQSDEAEMFIITEKFEFSAMHKLWNDRFDQAGNDELFGKCANPAGHGHNYILEVSVEKEAETNSPQWQVEFQKVVKEQFLDLVDHKNLNVDVEEFQSLNPTVENLSALAWQKLHNKFSNAALQKIVVWENDRTFCSYQGPE